MPAATSDDHELGAALEPGDGGLRRRRDGCCCRGSRIRRTVLAATRAARCCPPTETSTKRSTQCSTRLAAAWMVSACP